MVKYMDVNEAAEKFGVTKATISQWCLEGKIQGAVQEFRGQPWHIPVDAVRPQRRSHSRKAVIMRRRQQQDKN